MNAERLLKLADVLESLTEVKSDYGNYYRLPWDGVVLFDLEEWFRDLDVEEDDAEYHIPDFCGTAVCACGVAALHPDFNREGLLRKADIHGAVCLALECESNTYWSWDAINVFFGFMTEEELGLIRSFSVLNPTAESSWLFSQAEYPSYSQTPKHVAARIRALVANDGIPEDWEDKA